MHDGILSIQSSVAYGHVGNSAAVFPLQRLGFEVWPVNTVLFSNHTGYGQWRGHVVELPQVEEIVQGIEERGAFPHTRAVLSGYLGAPPLGEALLRTVAKVRGARPGALFVCDPVMGDEGRGFFVRPGIPELFRERIVPRADIVTPNAFELAWLAGTPIESIADACRAAGKARALGPSVVVATSLKLPERPGELGILADTALGSWLCWTPELPVKLNGTGDAFTALLLGWWLRTGSVPEALSRAVSAMYALVEATHGSGSGELELVAAQGSFEAPERMFVAELVG
jgi:pyridoxine kinase